MSLESSTEQTTEEMPDVTAESSTATEDVTAETALDHVNNLLAEDSQEESSTSTEEGEVQTQSEDLPFNEHPRFKELIDQKNRYQEMAKPFESAQEMGLTGEDINQAVQLMAALKSDPTKATELLNPHIENLQRVNGQVLDEDLQGRVNQGVLDIDSATELQQLRVQKQMEAQKAEANEAQNIRNAMASEATAWETQIAASDPDFEMKKPVVMGLVKGLIASRKPTTAEDAKAIMQEAYETANQFAAAAKPKANSIEPLNNTKPSPQQAEPRTALEAAKQALARTAK